MRSRTSSSNFGMVRAPAKLEMRNYGFVPHDSTTANRVSTLQCDVS